MLIAWSVSSGGALLFTYDTANRLTSVVNAGVTTQFTYNGDGDRLAQIVAGVVTNYSLDPTGLAQVLIETTSGQNTHYLPGLAQYNGSAWNYSLPDRLGSVRQMVDPSAAVLLARSYDPFGNVLEQVAAKNKSHSVWVAPPRPELKLRADKGEA
jgi:YD repeat-containing protein